MFKVVKCDSYNEKTVKKSLNKLLDLKSFIKKDDLVLIKPNLLFAAKPERLITTHPAIIKAIVTELKKLGAKAIIADSPGGMYNKAMLKNVYKLSGMEKVSKQTNCELNYDFSTYDVNNPMGFLKKYKLISVYKKVDKVINVPKIKTHMLCGLTCATKNLFGLIPGTEKVSFHARFKDVNDFSKMLVDLALVAKPTISIIDGVWGMEGEGPSNGKKKKIGVLIAGTNTFQIDYNVCKIIGHDYKNIPYLKIAKDKGLFEENKLSFKDYKTEFEKAHSSFFRKLWNKAPNFVKNLLSNVWVEKPIINKKECIGCADCMRACPVKAITIKNGKSVIDYNKCIRCYCCHELCRYKAVFLKKKIF